MPRILDLFLLFVALPLLLPLFLITFIAVRIKLGSPVFYRQERGGIDGERFMILKFRSMTDEKDEHGHLLPDQLRLPKFGRILRASSLDELPCFFNVLAGDMALVGPRPFMSEYLPLYTPEQMLRHGVRPGITGWAQVNGRNALTWEEKFELDVWYVRNRSFWLDVYILFLTVKKVFLSHDVNAPEDATMPRFTGTK